MANPNRPQNGDGRFMTSSGIEIGEVYTAADLQPDYEARLGRSGEYPFTRGIHPSMYRGRLWTMRQYSGYATARETNQRFHFLLEHGETGLSTAFDLPTQMGYDPDHPLAAGEVGRVGVSISSLDDMEMLLDGIPLDKVSTSMTINATAAILLALYVAVAQKQGVALSELRGTVQNDILKEYIARGTYIYPPGPSLRLVTDIMAYGQAKLPQWNTISISGYHMREAGANAVQEVAFTLANAVAYVQAALARGLSVDDFAPRISFFFAVHNNFLEEVAKFRAARRLWAQIMHQRFRAESPRSWMMRFHAQTAGSTLTAQQPQNNIIRVTLQALAAVLGGTQSLHTNSMDEALALPSPEAAELALRTQQIIAYESGVPDTADPLGGSYYLERLTDEIQERAQKYIEQIDRQGGAVSSLEYMVREIEESAYYEQRAIEAGSRSVVGVNKFVTPPQKPHSILRVDPSVRQAQLERVQKLRRRRDARRVEAALMRLEEVARGDKNLVPLILECVQDYATLGEISDTLRGVFGEYRAT